MYRAERAAMCDDAGRLVGVRYGVFAEVPTVVPVIVLDFESGSWTLAVDPDDDTLRISAGGGSGSGEVGRDDIRIDPAPAGSPWAGALGAAAQWVWILENQQGYHDGLQFCFAVDRTEVCRVQLIAAASGWQVSAVSPHRARPQQPCTPP